MIGKYSMPTKRFKFYLRAVEGLNRNHAREVVERCNIIANQAGNINKVSSRELREIGAKEEEIKAIEYYERFRGFMRKAERRKGTPVLFKQLARDYGTSINSVKRVFMQFLIHKGKEKKDYLSTDGLSIFYRLPEPEYIEFCNYLERDIKENAKRYHTYKDFISK